MPVIAENPCRSIAEAEIWDWIDSVFQDHHEKNAAYLAIPHTQDAALFPTPTVHEHAPVLFYIDESSKTNFDLQLQAAQSQEIRQHSMMRRWRHTVPLDGTRDC